MAWSGDHSTQAIRQTGQRPASSAEPQTKQRESGASAGVAAPPERRCGSGGGEPDRAGAEAAATGDGLAGASGGLADGAGDAGVSGRSSASLSRDRRRNSSIVPATHRSAKRSRPVRQGFRAARLDRPVTDGPEDRLRTLGLALPPPPAPKGSYAAVVRSGSLAWVAGQIVLDGSAVAHPGSVDRDVAPSIASDLAGRATLQALSALAAELGGLDRIRRAVRVGVFVSVSPGFHREHEVANGATDLLLRLFGDAGRPTRATVGVAGLPLNAPVEVELLVEVA